MSQWLMLTPEKMVQHMITEGVSFTIMTEQEAIEYLTRSTNFFKLNTYKRNYPRKRPHEGAMKKYIDLEFAYLQELSQLDQIFRRVLSVMCLDIEHFIKVRLLSLAQNDPLEDGYRMVRGFKDSLGKGVHALNNEIERNCDNPYCGALIGKYDPDDLPLWAFIEVIPFGRLLRLYQYYTEHSMLENEARIAHLLEYVRDVRNAVAHNNCMLNDLRSKQPHEPFYIKAPEALVQAIASLGFSHSKANTYLSNPRIIQLTALFYLYGKIVTDIDEREFAHLSLQAVVKKRMLLHKDYFIGNPLLVSCYELLVKMVDTWCVWA